MRAFLCLLFAWVFAHAINVSAVFIDDNDIVKGSDRGEVFLNDKKIVSLESGMNFLDEIVYEKIIDIYKDKEQIAFLSRFDEKITLHLYEKEKVKHIKIQDNIKNVFLYKNNIVLIGMDSTLRVLDSEQKEIFAKHFLDSSINTAKKYKNKIYIGFESGDVMVFNLDDKTFIKSKNKHFDSVWSVDISDDRLLSCGTDRKVLLDGAVAFKEDFIIYACAINGKNIAYTYNENNDIKVFLNGELKIIKNDKNYFIQKIFLNKNSLYIMAFDEDLIKKDLNE